MSWTTLLGVWATTFNCEAEAVVTRVSNEPSPSDSQTVHGIRFFMGRPVSDSDITSHFNHYVRLMVSMCFIAEKKREAAEKRGEAVPHGARSFRVLPMPCAFVPRHVAITTSVLHQMCTHISATKKQWLPGSNVPHNASGFSKAKDRVWRALFDVAMLETTRRRFDHYVSSDGVACSVLLARPPSAHDADNERRHGPNRYDFNGPVDENKLVASKRREQRRQGKRNRERRRRQRKCQAQRVHTPLQTAETQETSQQQPRKRKRTLRPKDAARTAARHGASAAMTRTQHKQSCSASIGTSRAITITRTGSRR